VALFSADEFSGTTAGSTGNRGENRLIQDFNKAYFNEQISLFLHPQFEV